MESKKQYEFTGTLFQCPVCTKEPVSEVYQCKNGHMLCHQCIGKVGATCPQCRVPFGKNKIRNLALEAILDEVIFPCLWNKYGCTHTMKRTELEAHKKICPKRSVNICPNLGFARCNRLAQSDVLIGHLLRKHGLTLANDNSFSNGTVFNVNFEDIPSNPTETKNLIKYMEAKLEEKIEPFLVPIKILEEGNGQNLNCAVIYLGDKPSKLDGGDDFEFKINLFVHQKNNEEHVRACGWNGYALHFIRAAEDAKAIPWFSTSINYIKSRLDPQKGNEFELIQVVVELIIPSRKSGTKDDHRSNKNSDYDRDFGEDESDVDISCSNLFLELPFAKLASGDFNDGRGQL